MAEIDFLEVNPIADVVKGTDFVTVGTPTTGAIELAQLLHGTIITFSNAFAAVKQRAVVEEFVLLQTMDPASGDVLVQKAMTVLLYNSDIITLVAAAEIVYKATYDSENCIGSFTIPADSWVVEGETIARATVHPNIQLKGNIGTTIGKNIYAAIIGGDVLPLTLPTGFALAADLKLKHVGSLDEA